MKKFYQINETPEKHSADRLLRFIPHLKGIRLRLLLTATASPARRQVLSLLPVTKESSVSSECLWFITVCPMPAMPTPTS